MSNRRTVPGTQAAGNRKQRRATARLQLRASKRRGSAAASGAAFALGIGLATSNAHANTFTVTNANDSGAGSLRDAVGQANALAGADTIDLSGVSGTITLTSGQISIQEQVSILGPGAATLALSGNNASRVFNMYRGSVSDYDVLVSGLTIAGGNVTGTGGGITARNINLTLEDVVIRDNIATDRGGGLYLDVSNLTIRRSRISGNQSSASNGGGIAIRKLSDNQTIQIEDTRITGNSAVNGGGIGARRLYGHTTLERSTIDENIATASGGGLNVERLYDDSTLEIRETTISENVAQNGSGGGINVASNRGAFTLENSTLSANEAANSGGAIHTNSQGGSSTFVIENSTITGNAQTGNVEAAGIWLNNRSLQLDHTIVSGNTPVDLIALGTGTFVATNSLVEDPGAVSLASGTITGVDPQLGPLQDNGGPTRTHLPASGSPVINAGDPLFTPMLGATDQRGNSRRVGGVIDIGSVEVAAPTITAISDRMISEDGATFAIPFTIGDSDYGTGGLTVSAMSSDTALVPNDANTNLVVAGTGASRTITVTPAANASGDANITISVGDGANTTTLTFALHVTAVDDPPTVSSIANQSLPEDGATAALGFTIGDIDTPVGDLVVTGQSSNTILIPNDSIVFGGSGASRTVTVAPAENRSSVSPATITINVSDGHSSTPRTFTVSVHAVDDSPTIDSIANQSTNEDTSTEIAITVGDVDTIPATLTLSGTSSNTEVVANSGITFGGSGTSRTVSIAPVANATGATIITVTVSDGESTTSRTFALSVDAVNDAPTVSAISDQTIREATATSAIAFTIGDLETSPGSLTVSAASSDQTLVPDANVVLAGTGADRSVTVTPLKNMTGTADIVVSVSDGNNTTTSTFKLTVDAVGHPPTISMIDDQTIDQDTSTDSIAFTVGDMDGTDDLVVSATSSNQNLLPDSRILLRSSGPNQTIKLTPYVGEYGSTTLTVVVTDGVHAASTTFTLHVSEVDASSKPDAGAMNSHGSSGGSTEADGGQLTIKRGNCSVIDPGQSPKRARSLIAGFLGLIALRARRRRRSA